MTTEAPMTIAERDLDYIGTDGIRTKVAVRLFAPEEGSWGDWSCRYEIAWPNGLENGRVHGVDQFQAIILTLQRIGVRIYLSDYHKTGRLYFKKPGSGYGFPVTKNARDLLVGDDRRFDGDD